MQTDTPTRYSYLYAKDIADRIVSLLEPHCLRVEIAGSIRRQEPMVKDIEIVAIPRDYNIGLFEDGLATVVNRWPKVKGDLQYGHCKYTQRILPEGIKLDLFFAEPGNWGLIYAIRTGPADYSHQVLAVEWARRGYKSVDGYLTQNGRIHAVRDEKSLFKKLGLPYVDPQHRKI